MTYVYKNVIKKTFDRGQNLWSHHVELELDEHDLVARYINSTYAMPMYHFCCLGLGYL